MRQMLTRLSKYHKAGILQRDVQVVSFMYWMCSNTKTLAFHLFVWPFLVVHLLVTCCCTTQIVNIIHHCWCTIQDNRLKSNRGIFELRLCLIYTTTGEQFFSLIFCSIEMYRLKISSVFMTEKKLYLQWISLNPQSHKWFYSHILFEFYFLFINFSVVGLWWGWTCLLFLLAKRKPLKNLLPTVFIHIPDLIRK